MRKYDGLRLNENQEINTSGAFIFVRKNNDQYLLIAIHNQGKINNLGLLCVYRYIPDIISGDFDSASGELLSHYEQKVGMVFENDWGSMCVIFG